METEYSQARDVQEEGHLAAHLEMQQGLAAIALDERPFLGPLHVWSAAIQGKAGLLIIPTMRTVLMRWLADTSSTLATSPSDKAWRRPACVSFQ